MIVKLFRSGRSFAKLAAYLLHDPDKATTKERVSWTHTLNLASDDPGLAVDEMLWTFRGADWLKEQAGVRAGGRLLEYPVRHFSLNWHPSEKPSREQMIEAVESFLKYFGWQDHQALIARHDDKQHHHVHVMLNAVHPETGRALNASFERRWAQRWALEYEREHGKIFCEERLKPVEDREASPTRDAWMRLKESELKNDRAEYERITKEFDFFTRKDPQNQKDYEWEVLKTAQKKERVEYFMDGKQAFKELRAFIFSEVRTEFQGAWRALYAAKRKGMKPKEFVARKAELVSEQKKVLDERRKEACDALQKRRDHAYKLVRIRQQDERDGLKERQQHGLVTFPAYENLSRTQSPARQPEPQKARPKLKPEIAREFNRAKREVGSPDRPNHSRNGKSETPAREPSPRSEQRAPTSQHERSGKGVASLGLGILGALSALAEKIADGFLGEADQPKRPPVEKQPEPESEFVRDPAVAAAEQAAHECQVTEAEKLMAQWESRRKRGRNRD